MKTIKLTMAQALLRFLDCQYVRFNSQEHKFVVGIMAVFGHGNVLGLGEAIANTNHNLRFTQAYNEQSMGHMAVAFAKQSRNKQIYALTSSVGPGATNMVTAAATATANRIPVLFLPGDVYATRQPDPVLQQIEVTHSAAVSANDAFKPVSVYWDRIDRPEKLMQAMINAMLALTNPANQGAVTIALPQDVQGETYDYPLAFFKRNVYTIPAPQPVPDDLDTLFKALQNARQPLVICGGGVMYSEAEAELKRFVEKHQVPIAETQAGKSALAFDHPWNLGGIGTTGFMSANQYAKKTDLVIGMGTRYTDFTTASKSLFPTQTRFININTSRLDAKKMAGQAIIADVRLVLRALNRSGLKANKPELLKLVTKLKKAANKEITRLHNIQVSNVNDFQPEVNDPTARRQVQAFAALTKSTFSQTAALGIINQTIPTDAIVVAASGSLPGDLQRIWKPYRTGTYHVEYGYSCMGYEVGGALGVKLARPQQEVYALVGDGAYMMLHSALVTALQERQKINVLLFNNSTFGCINNLQVSKGMASLGTEFKVKMPGISPAHAPIMHVNYAQQAASYGAKTYRVKTRAELLQALQDAEQQTLSTLIDIVVLPKTMTHDYDAWWRVGNPQTSVSATVRSKTKEDRALIEKLRSY